MSFTFEFLLDPWELAIHTQSGAVPRPTGVWLDIAQIPPGQVLVAAGGVMALVAGVLFGWAKKKGADTKVAQAEASEAKAKQEAAEMNAAIAQGNAAAAQAGERSVANRAKADKAADHLTDDEINEALRRQGALREDGTK